MDIENLETFLLASIAVPNQSKPPRKVRLIPQPVMVTTVPCHPDALAGKIMVPEVSVIGASQGRQYKGEWALLTRHSADYISDIHPHPLTFSKIVWKRIRLAQTNVGITDHPFTDVISLYNITQQHAVQTKIAMISSLPKCTYFERDFEFRSELGIFNELKNDTVTIKVFAHFLPSFIVHDFTPRNIILCLSYCIHEYEMAETGESSLRFWIRTISQIIKLFGVIDSFYTDVLVLQPDKLINPNISQEYLSTLKQVLSDRIEKYEAVIDLIILPLQTKLELAGIVSPEASVLFAAQDALTRLKAGVQSSDPQQLVELLQRKLHESFPREAAFWFELLQKLGEPFWEQFVRELKGKIPAHVTEALIAQTDKLESDNVLDSATGFMPEMNYFALSQFLWQQRGAVHTISDAVKHEQLDSMRNAYKRFKFMRRFRPPAYTTFSDHEATPLDKLRLEVFKSETHGLLPQPLFRRGDYLFTKVNSTHSSANYLYWVSKYQTQKKNLVVVKPGCYLDLSQEHHEIYYKLVFIDRVTAAEFELGRKATPNGLGNPSVVGGLDLNQLISTGKLSVVDRLQYDVFCVEFSRKWIFMVLLANPKQFYLARLSICEGGSAVCTLDLFRTLQMSSNPVKLTELRFSCTMHDGSSRAIPLCYLEVKNQLLMAELFGKRLTGQLGKILELKICLMVINSTDSDMTVGVHSAFDSEYTIDSANLKYYTLATGHSPLYRPELGFYFKWQLIEGRIFGVWLKNTHEYTVYALHRGRFIQTYSGKLKLGLSPGMEEYREILPSSHGAYWLPFAIAQRTAYQPGQYMSLEVQTLRLKLI